MEVTLLGTGAADGWPNPFCTCGSCAAAVAAGELRAPTSALVDGRILLDCGPETPRQTLRAGTDLSGVHTVLVTHADPDHFDPAFLLYRSWVSDAPLQLVGPPPVIEACTHWLAPDQTAVRLQTVRAGDVLCVNGYTVTALPAAHLAWAGPDAAVLYAVRSPAGPAVLYATDTGEPAGDQLADWSAAGPYALVLLEETFGHREELVDPGSSHHTLAGFGRTVARMRAAGMLAPGGRVAAVHLSHHNPPPPELAAALATHGAELLPDGTRVQVAPEPFPSAVGEQGSPHAGKRNRPVGSGVGPYDTPGVSAPVPRGAGVTPRSTDSIESSR